MITKAITTAISISLGVVGGLAQAETVDNTNTLPSAKPGQCYAKVMVPARYEVSEDPVLVREEAEKIESIPAEYTLAEEKVLVQEGRTQLVPVPAVFEEVVEEIEVRPAEKYWTTRLDKRGIPVSSTLVDSAKAGGVDVENALPGMCFREYLKPAQYDTKTEDVIISPESEKVETVPATYEWVEEQVLVKEAAKEIVEVPATFETVVEEVLIEPVKTVWKKGAGPVQKIDNTTGEIMCLVEIPAVYKTVTKSVIKTPAVVQEVEIPAVYKTVKVGRLKTPETEQRTKVPAVMKTVAKQVKVADASFNWHATHDETTPEGEWTGNQICLKEVPAEHETVTKQVVKTAASVKEEQIPAVYETVKVRKLVAAAKEDRTKIPAEYKTVTKRKKVADERLEWQQVLCETNMTKDIVIRTQQALDAAGYKPGSADGILGESTLRAIDAYQRDKGLPSGGLTIETLGSLGINI